MRRISLRLHRSRSPLPGDQGPEAGNIKVDSPIKQIPASPSLVPCDPHCSDSGALLALPREIRDQILAYVLERHQNDPPALDQSFQELTRDRKIPNKPQLASWTKIVLHDPKSIRANATSLLLANHQLRSEVLENIERLDARVYELDIILLDETLPILTWLRVPICTTQVEKVNVAFRISGSYDEARMHQWQPQSDDKLAKRYATYDRYKGFRGHGDGWSSCYPIAIQLYSILERFIKAGPVGDMSKESEHRHVVVKAINIDVQTPGHVYPARYGTPMSAALNTLPHGTVLRPKFLARSVANYIAALLNGTNFDTFWFGKIAFEHVDKFSVLQDGKLLRTIDVAERLKALQYFPHEEERFSVEQMEEFKSATWHIRKERGLKCLDH